MKPEDYDGTKHSATVKKATETFQLFYKDEVILETDQAVKLVERYDDQTFPAVIYFPESAVSSLETQKTDFSTHCPIKGDASYWTYKDAENGIWAYENPLADLPLLKGHYAFAESGGFKVAAK